MRNFLVVWPSSVPRMLADEIATSLRQGQLVNLLALGPGSMLQAMTATELSRAALVRDGLAVALVTEFVDRDEDGNERTALSLFAAPFAVPSPDPSVARVNGF